jgi:hypothetical protein
MAGRSLQEILAPTLIKERISRLALSGTSLQRLFGWNVGVGALDDQTLDGVLGFREGDVTADGMPRTGNIDDWEARSGQYDIFDHTRRLATGRNPGTASGRRAPQKVSFVQFTIPRSAEIMPLTDEDLHNRRPIGGPTSDIDRGGMRYIEAQERYLAELVGNVVEFQTMAMIRGSYTFTQKGDDLEQTYSGGEVTINYQQPAGNRDRLNMLGAGNIIDADWDLAGTDIPSQLNNINAAMVQLTGKGLKHIIVRGQTWEYVKNNTKIATQGGSANVVFDTQTRERPGEFTAVLRALPQYTWHILEYGHEIWDGTDSYDFTPMVELKKAAFLPEPDSEWTEYIRGGEWVTEGPNGPRSFQMGFYPYAYNTHDPSGWNLGFVFNGFPALKVPSAMAYGTIDT